jgi:3-oxoacyl-[acyl-carrier-protein] synthase II
LNVDLSQRIVITGLGMLTPLGRNAGEVLRRVEAGECAAVAPKGFDAATFGCPLCAYAEDFDAREFVSEAKLVRLMNREAQLAVASARLALGDAGVKPGSTYEPGQIALFGATGMAGLPLREVLPLIKVSAGPNGQFDPIRFGRAGLRTVSPLLSFKILSNMPFCFVSINENLQGPNAIYTPWEGQGAMAVAAAIEALQTGDARCALVGACDVRTHELAFAALQQQGLFNSWGEGVKRSIVPGEGAAFVVLEKEEDAVSRGAHPYATIEACSLRAGGSDAGRNQVRNEVLRRIGTQLQARVLVSSASGDAAVESEEQDGLGAARLSSDSVISPKKHLGDLFAAAALVQLALGAVLSRRTAGRVLVNCFGHGSTQASFLLGKA